jgi:glyoxylase I family protein
MPLLVNGFLPAESAPPTALCINGGNNVIKRPRTGAARVQTAIEETGMPVEVLGIDHIFITVHDLAVAEEYYDKVMKILGFRKNRADIAGEPHVHYYNRYFAYWLRPAREAAVEHNSYAAGLHHVCFRVGDQADVDRAVLELEAAGISASAPRLYPEYGKDYYAAFFADPDGVRLEIRNFGEWWRRAITAWKEEATV